MMRHAERSSFVGVRGLMGMLQTRSGALPVARPASYLDQTCGWAEARPGMGVPEGSAALAWGSVRGRDRGSPHDQLLGQALCRVDRAAEEGLGRRQVARPR